MRTLERNKTSLWYVTPLEPVEETDSDGFKTGQMIKPFSTPVLIRINIYPSTGDIIEEIFGSNASYDQIAVSTDIELVKGTLLFYSHPEGNYDKIYDFAIESIRKSINTFNYGLRSRT